MGSQTAMNDGVYDCVGLKPDIEKNKTKTGLVQSNSLDY